METWLEEFPPLEQPSRFGNKAFRQWYDKVAASALLLCEQGGTSILVLLVCGW